MQGGSGKVKGQNSHDQNGKSEKNGFSFFKKKSRSNDAVAAGKSKLLFARLDIPSECVLLPVEDAETAEVIQAVWSKLSS